MSGKLKEDLTGKQFGLLTVVERCGSNKNNAPLWRCSCACGNEVLKTRTALKKAKNASCGCNRQPEDLSGMVFGYLTALERCGSNKYGKGLYKCRCRCGKVLIVDSQSLKTGNTRSCGCLHNELLSERMTTHGMSKTRLYRVWKNIVKRCKNPNSKNYKDYGGRGITVCDRWLKFESFYDDMGVGYREDLEIDRIDNDKGYYPDNCRWVTHSDNQRNKRTNHRVTTSAGNLTVAGLAEKANVDYGTMISRIKRGREGDELLLPTRDRRIVLDREDAITTVTELAEKSGMCEATIRGRIRKGWRDEDLTITPYMTENHLISTPYGKMTIPQLSRLTGIPYMTLMRRKNSTWNSADMAKAPQGKKDQYHYFADERLGVSEEYLETMHPETVIGKNAFDFLSGEHVLWLDGHKEIEIMLGTIGN